MHRRSYRKIIIGIAIAAAVSAAAPALAQTSSGSNAATAPYTLLEPLPCLNTTGVTCSSDSSGNSTFSSISLQQFIPYAYKFLLALAVALAVFEITVGGFEYMLSGAMDTKSNAKKRMTDAALGLTLALITYLVLYTIDPNLVNSNNLNLPPVGQSASSSSGTSH
jgi:hypothetical protein